MTGSPISRALFFWPGVLLIRLGQWALSLSETRAGRHTILPAFRAFCRFVLYARPYFVRSTRTNNVVTTLQLTNLINRHRLIAVIPCACRAGQTACTNPHHGKHDLDVCLSFGLAAVVQIGSGLGNRLTPDEAEAMCQQSASSGLAHHSIYSFGSLLEVRNCCAETCSVAQAFKTRVSQAVRPSPLVAVRGANCDGCEDRDTRVCEDVCPYGLRPSSTDCLGCDLCSTRCPRNAIVMEEREPNQAPESASQ